MLPTPKIVIRATKAADDADCGILTWSFPDELRVTAVSEII